MAPATTSPVKILTDLGYEVWEMETDADMLRALVEAINTLTITNPSDGRIPILQSAVIEIRKGRRAASPSKGMNYTEKRTTLKGSKFIPRAKPASRPKASPTAMLPPAQEEGDQTVFSALLNGLKGIASLLKNISTLLGVQFIFKKLLAARQRRRDKLAEKRAREEELEGKPGIGTKISSVISKPVQSVFANLLNFFKNIILGSAVLGFYKWMKDPKNLETIKGISEWFQKNGKAVLIGIAALLGLRVGFRLYRIFRRVGQLIRTIGRFVNPRTVPRGASSISKAILEQNRIRSKLASQATQRAALRSTTASATASRTLAKAGSIKTTQEIASELNLPRDKFLSQVTQADRVNPARGDIPNSSKLESNIENIFNRTSTDPKKLPNLEKAFDKPTRFPIDVPGQGRLSMTDDQFEVLNRLVQGTLSQDAADDLIKAKRAIEKTTTVSGSEIMKTGKGTGPLAGIRSKFVDIADNFTKPFKGALEKFMSKAAVKTGGNILARGLPFVGAALDFASMIEEAKRGNLTAAFFFGAGSASSLLSGLALSSVAFAPLAAPLSAFSFAMSLLGIGASIIQDSMRSRGDTSKVITGRKTGSQRRAEYNLKRNEIPDLSMNKKKKEVNVVVVPNNSGGGQSNPSGGTSEVNLGESTDPRNSDVEVAEFTYNMRESQ